MRRFQPECPPTWAIDEEGRRMTIVKLNWWGRELDQIAGKEGFNPPEQQTRSAKRVKRG